MKLTLLLQSCGEVEGGVFTIFRDRYERSAAVDDLGENM